MEIPLSLIGHKETIEIDEEWNEDRTEIVNLRKVPGSNRTWILLKTESGQEIQLEVIPADFDAHIMPMLSAYSDAMIKASGKIH